MTQKRRKYQFIIEKSKYTNPLEVIGQIALLTCGIEYVHTEEDKPLEEIAYLGTQTITVETKGKVFYDKSIYFLGTGNNEWLHPVSEELGVYQLTMRHVYSDRLEPSYIHLLQRISKLSPYHNDKLENSLQKRYLDFFKEMYLEEKEDQFDKNNPIQVFFGFTRRGIEDYCKEKEMEIIDLSDMYLEEKVIEDILKFMEDRILNTSYYADRYQDYLKKQRFLKASE